MMQLSCFKSEYKDIPLLTIRQKTKILKMSGTETQNQKHVYHDYGAENVYDEYELSEEDQILKELNARYSKKPAYVVLALVTVVVSTVMIIMSQRWQPHEITTTTTTTTTSTTTTSTTTTLPQGVDLLDQVFQKSSIVYLTSQYLSNSNGRWSIMEVST